ncbi:MAG TPA: DUF485 domain-containing protein [Armatimonadota bacterium]|nr:DUF485 domain-containing protein [Armatimonadota bacterium]
MPEMSPSGPRNDGRAAHSGGIQSDSDLTGTLMRRQALLGVRVAAVFLILVLGMPLLTHFRPDWTQQPILGFPASWFLLGLLFYPITWALSAYFVKASERMESEDAEMVRRERGLK